MLRKLLLPVLFVAFFASQAFAQTGSITGTVTNEQGEPVPTANVLLVEISRGAATNLDGEYTIENVEPGTYTLKVSFVGYTDYTTQVTIEAGETLTEDVTLKKGAVGLEELVVTGYGRKVGAESLTGSIATVETEEVENVPILSAGELLQGRAAGVQIQMSSGQPGAGFEVEIRGQGSINAGNRPLYIVNGVQISFLGKGIGDETVGNGAVESSPLAFLDPDNIASMQVLKDAAATAIYGAAGANGVVLIQTKSGFDGPTRITASVSRGFTEAAEPLDLMNTKQWFKFYRLARANVTGLDPNSQAVTDWILNKRVYPNSSYTPKDGIQGPQDLGYTNWIDFINRRGTNAKYQLTFAGGGEQTTFYIAGGYNETTGKIKNTGMQSYNLNTNITHNVSDEFSLGLNLTLSKFEQLGTCEDGYYVNCPVSAAVFMLPFNHPYNDDGSYTAKTNVLNIAKTLNEKEYSADVFNLLGNLSATYNFSPAISLRAQAGIDYSNNRGRIYESPVISPGIGGGVSTSVQYGINFTTSTTLNYRQTFSGKHNVSGLLGFEYRNDFYRILSAYKTGFPGSLFQVLSTAAEVKDADGYTQSFRKMGFFVNGKYNYDERYYIAATARYDGSSRFGSESYYGFFPSVSAGWNISEEDFYNSDIVTFLKLRASYGVSGNSQIGLYAARGLYEVGLNYGGTSAIFPSQLANPQLTWEEVKQLNIGLDFGLFDGRVNGSVNVYQAMNQQLLLKKPLPVTSGYSSILRNIGKIRNRGIEFSFNSTNVRAGNFVWSSNFNISYNQGEIQELSEGIEKLYPTDLIPYKVGYAPTAIQAIPWAGVNPADGRPLWYNADGNLTYNVTAKDMGMTGKTAAPEVVGGFGNTFSYKGLSLNIFFQYQFGGYAVPQTAFFFSMVQTAVSNTAGRPRLLTESWRKPGDIVPIPKPYLSSVYPGTAYWGNGDHQFFSTDYIRLKNISLSYSFPTSITEVINLTDLQVYVSAYNLVTWTNYPGYDPEVPGPFPASSYPIGRRVSAGIEVTF